MNAKEDLRQSEPEYCGDPEYDEEYEFGKAETEEGR